MSRKSEIEWVPNTITATPTTTTTANNQIQYKDNNIINNSCCSSLNNSDNDNDSNISSTTDICRICHCEADNNNPLLSPCYCAGSLKYVHQSCLQQWLTASDTRSCELCKFHFIMHTKIKPFNEWRRLDMSGLERRRLCCAVLFHCIAALCVMWSLFVLIDRAAEEIHRGMIAWPFWTKLVVVAVGFTGGAVFMYIQCRQYFTLCSRWRCHNRILLIQNAPEKVHIHPPSPVIHHVSKPASRSRRDIGLDAERGNHGQVIANIENNPGISNQNSVITIRQPINEQSKTISVESRSNHSSFYNSNSNTYYEEEDESGGFNDYKPNSFRRILTTETTRNYSIVPTERSKVNDKQGDAVDVRRYSDTRLLQSYDSRNVMGIKIIDAVPQLYESQPIDRRPNGQQYSKPVEYVTHSEEFLSDHPSHYVPYDKTVYRISDKFDGPITVPAQYDTQPQVSDIVFETGTHNYDPLELNIQEMLDLDIKTAQQRKKSVLSLTQGDQPVLCHKVNNYEENKSVFKSLPNLSASSENLLPQPDKVAS